MEIAIKAADRKGKQTEKESLLLLTEENSKAIGRMIN